MAEEIATIGGGCFWCLDAIYADVKGVSKVVSGYSGGEIENPTYEQVCQGTTGHAEVIQVHYDPSVVSYQDILNIFFIIHDPTTVNRQGNDVGTQYRSIILYHNDEQKAVAEATIERFDSEKLYDYPIVTEVAPQTNFYPAEEYHQGYYLANPMQPYCAFVISPKVMKFREKYADFLRS